MDMVPVRSSNIEAVGWQRGDTLAVRFVGGVTWTYTGVPRSIYERLVSATSVGKAFHRTVRDIYPGRQGEPPDLPDNEDDEPRDRDEG